MNRAAAAALVLVATLLVGCGQEAGPTTATPAAPSTPSTSDASSPAPGTAPGKRATISAGEAPESLRFTATTVDGRELDGASFTGTPVLLWFWAPWCPTCRSQVPQVEALAAEHQGELAVVGVGSLDTEDAIADFAGEVEGVTHLVDTQGTLWKKFGVTEQSSFVLLDADGDVAFETGYGGSDSLGAEVADVL